MHKKIVSMLLAMSLVATMAACGSSSSANGEPVKLQEVDGDYEISMLYSDNATYPYQEDWIIWEVFEKYAGAKIEVISVPESDFDTKRQMVMQSGDVPDILTKTAPNSAGITNPAEVLLPVSDYMDQMPNFKKFVEDNNYMEQLDNLREADGKFYFFPVKCGEDKNQLHQWMIRTDLLDEYGLEMPKTLEDLYNVAKVFKENNPESTPISNRFGSGNLIAGFASGFGTLGGWTIGTGMQYMPEDNNWVFAPTSDEFKEMVTYTTKMYEEGILDPEYATLDSTVYEQKVVQGDTFIMYAWVGNQRVWNVQGKEIDPDFKVEVIMPLVGPDGDAALEPINAWEQTWAIPATLAEDEKHLSEVLHFVDWCYSDDACVLTTMGIEGETSRMEGEDYVYMDAETNYTLTEGLWNNCLDVRVYARPAVLEDEKIDAETMERIAETGLVPSPPPGSPLSAEQKEDNSVISATLVSFVNTQMESFIAGQLSIESDWDAYVAECETKGSADLLEQYNEAWAARK